MVDLEDEPDWSVADEIEEDDNDRYHGLVNNNNNNHDNVYGSVIMAEPLREFTRFI